MRSHTRTTGTSARATTFAQQNFFLLCLPARLPEPTHHPSCSRFHSLLDLLLSLYRSPRRRRRQLLALSLLFRLPTREDREKGDPLFILLSGTRESAGQSSAEHRTRVLSSKERENEREREREGQRKRAAGEKPSLPAASPSLALSVSDPLQTLLFG